MEHQVNKYITAGSIISSLGFTLEENLQSIREYRSGIRIIEEQTLYDSPFMGACIDSDHLKRIVIREGLNGYSRMEQLLILSIQNTLQKSGLHPSDPACILILSTTKGNIDLLETLPGPDKGDLSVMAGKIASHFGFIHKPILLSTACISGVSAIIAASRLLAEGKYKHIIAAGGDMLTRFVVTGFQSFKSVSADICRPYDKKRDGLSLGEAAGAVLITVDKQFVYDSQPVVIEGGAITNDANHISGPSRTGDGLYLAISQAMKEGGVYPEDISFVNAHGTATVYNDEMESKAIHWAALDNKPVNSLKSFWGHTLGASGIIETIVCMEELRSGELFGIVGFEESDVTYRLDVSSQHRKLPLKRCVKTASGFGGCNAAIILALASETKKTSARKAIQTHITQTCIIEKGTILLNGNCIFDLKNVEDFPAFIRAAYKTVGTDDRKFYKMDDLSKLGYIAAACLFAGMNEASLCEPQEKGIVLSNASSSLDSDRKHLHEINTLGNREASPAIFVYTLPNVMMGELCIRYKIQGENTFFITPHYEEDLIRRYAELAMERQQLRACLIGWCELVGNEYKAIFKWLERKE
jgi:3-oxoacyl-(acyl-carrier-protein) synthase